MKSEPTGLSLSTQPSDTSAGTERSSMTSSKKELLAPGYTWNQDGRTARSLSGTELCRTTPAPSRPEVGVSQSAKKPRLRGGTYSLEEVCAIVEGYEELTELRHKPWILVRLLDMWRAYGQISHEFQEAVLLMGLMGYSSRQAAPLTYVSHSTVSRRYASGLAQLVIKMNGG